jgi:hypothetical protein
MVPVYKALLCFTTQSIKNVSNVTETFMAVSKRAKKPYFFEKTPFFY